MSKQRQSRFAIISIALTLGAFTLFVFATFVDPLSAYSTELMVAGLALLIASWGIYFFGGRRAQKPEESTENVITVIGCGGCDFREERAFTLGDYIFKELGQCKKCPGNSYIRAIYAVPLKK
ncbi:MAG: hypothetical protein FJZ49_01565 [Candidatus Verstraetearchaeota archaeon]|nr:hypothetical protein [Candidatus Verstraetearchaeota archaeon]